MRVIRQATSVDLPIGPFLDETDGKTAETALTITQPDIRLKKNGAAWAQKAAAQTLTHEEAGWYEVTLDATDTDTCGHLLVAVHESGALPVWCEFQVVEEAVYDAFYAASAIGYVTNAAVNVAQFGGSNGTFASGRPEVNTSHIAGVAVSTTTAQIGVNVVQISTDATAADNLETMLDGTGGQSLTATFVGNQTGNLSGSVGSVTGAVGSVTGAVGSVTGAVGSVTGAVGSVAAGGITASSIAADAIGASELAADAASEIAAAVLAAAVVAPIDANIQKINDVTVLGDGSVTPWGP